MTEIVKSSEPTADPELSVGAHLEVEVAGETIKGKVIGYDSHSTGQDLSHIAGELHVGAGGQFFLARFPGNGKVEVNVCTHETVKASPGKEVGSFEIEDAASDISQQIAALLKRKHKIPEKGLSGVS